MHAEASRVNGAVAVVRALGQALEVGLPNHQHRRAEPTFGDQAAHEQRVVVLETVRPNDYVDLAIGQNGAALGLDRDVLAIAEPLHEPVDAAVGQRQKHVQQASRLLRHRGPKAELEDLPACPPLIGPTRGYRVDGATLTYISRA